MISKAIVMTKEKRIKNFVCKSFLFILFFSIIIFKLAAKRCSFSRQLRRLWIVSSRLSSLLLCVFKMSVYSQNILHSEKIIEVKECLLSRSEDNIILAIDWIVNLVEKQNGVGVVLKSDLPLLMCEAVKPGLSNSNM